MGSYVNWGGFGAGPRTPWDQYPKDFNGWEHFVSEYGDYFYDIDEGLISKPESASYRNKVRVYKGYVIQDNRAEVYYCPCGYRLPTKYDVDSCMEECCGGRCFSFDTHAKSSRVLNAWHKEFHSHLEYVVERRTPHDQELAYEKLSRIKATSRGLLSLMKWYEYLHRKFGGEVVEVGHGRYLYTTSRAVLRWRGVEV